MKEDDFNRLQEFVTALRIKPAVPPDSTLWDVNLPPRVFARDYYPRRARINAYSRPEYLAEIAVALDGTPELKKIMESQFGKLFGIPQRKSVFSGKIVHNLLCRQLWTTKPHELWFVFGGKPIRFSLREFCVLTGLKCGPYPDAEVLAERQKTEGISSKYISELVGNRRCVKVPDLVQMLKHNKKWPGWKKLSVALVIIVEGVVATKSQLGLVNEKHVEMCRDVDFFLDYPWGRHSFEDLLFEIVEGKSQDALETMVGRLKQSSIAMHGLSLAIQLLAYESIDGLDKIHRETIEDVQLTQRYNQDLARKRQISGDDIINCELADNLEVETIIHTTDDFKPEVLVWEDDVDDPRVQLVERLHKSGHNFGIYDWPHGDYSCDRVYTPAEKAVLKEYDLEVFRRSRSSVSGMKREGTDGVEAVGSSANKRPRRNKINVESKKELVDSVDSGMTPAKKRLRKASKPVAPAFEFSGTTLAEAVIHLKSFIREDIASALGKPKPRTTAARKRNAKAQSTFEEKVILSDDDVHVEEDGVHGFDGTGKNPASIAAKGKGVLVDEEDEEDVDTIHVDSEHMESVHMDSVHVDNVGCLKSNPDNFGETSVEAEKKDGTNTGDGDVPEEKSTNLFSEYVGVEEAIRAVQSYEGDNSNDNKGGEGSEEDNFDREDVLVDFPTQQMSGQPLGTGVDGCRVGHTLTSWDVPDLTDKVDKSHTDVHGTSNTSVVLVCNEANSGVPSFESENSKENKDGSEEEKFAREGVHVNSPIQQLRGQGLGSDVDGGGGDGTPLAQKVHHVTNTVEKSIEVVHGPSPIRGGVPVMSHDHESEVDVDFSTAIVVHLGADVLPLNMISPPAPNVNGHPHDVDGGGGEAADLEFGRHGGEQDEEDDHIVLDEDKLCNSNDDPLSPPPPGPVLRRRGSRLRNPTSKVQSLIKDRVLRGLPYDPFSKLKKGDVTRVMQLSSLQTEPFVLTCGLEVESNFFSNLAKKNEALGGNAMEVLVSLLWHKMADLFRDKHAVIVDHWPMSLMRAEYKNFKAGHTSGKHTCHFKLKQYAIGTLPARENVIGWGAGVEMIYCPMYWQSNHWVGLVINIKERAVLILDPCCSATDIEAVGNHMKPVVEITPYLLAECTGQDYDTSPFTWTRNESIYQVKKVGDNGPIVAKFLEMHALGCTTYHMCKLSEELVLRVRKKFAVDVYDTFGVAS